MGVRPALKLTVTKKNLFYFLKGVAGPGCTISWIWVMYWEIAPVFKTLPLVAAWSNSAFTDKERAHTHTHTRERERERERERGNQAEIETDTPIQSQTDACKHLVDISGKHSSIDNKYTQIPAHIGLQT
jgi:hypothetical protein